MDVKIVSVRALMMKFYNSVVNQMFSRQTITETSWIYNTNYSKVPLRKFYDPNIAQFAVTSCSLKEL